MFAHMAWCYTQLRDYAADTAHPLTLTWIVRSRFDNVFFAPVPALQGLATDAVHSRARRIGHGWHNVDNEMISYLPLRQTFLLILSSFRIGMPECGCPVTFPHILWRRYWMWGDVCGDRAGQFRCVYRDRPSQEDASGKCM